MAVEGVCVTGMVFSFSLSSNLMNGWRWRYEEVL